jgi:hypothetical protein
MAALAQAYAVCRVDPDDPRRRIYDCRDEPYSQRMTGAVTRRSCSEPFVPVQQPERYTPGRNWRHTHTVWPQRHGALQLLDVGPYRVRGHGAALVKVRCDCGTAYHVPVSTWLGQNASNLPPQQCQQCYQTRKKLTGHKWMELNELTKRERNAKKARKLRTSATWK